ncbi:MAG: XRE family transcriptional regulator [Xanthobacteraceae bacterium]|nr:MAG: XRE family transcriptional regulator [Xanthobacteraceae bacterium]
MKSQAAAVHKTATRKVAARGIATAARSAPTNWETLGIKIRAERERRGMALREMARRVGVSPSLISQIERGLVTPSVGTLWSMATELGLVMDELFRTAEQTTAASEPAGPAPLGHVQRRDSRKRLRLAGGVEWERLTAQPDDDVEFLYVKYEAGAESCPEDSLFRHGGKEYAYVLEGRLGVQIGFERYELGPGDSVSFQSQSPHRLWAIGDAPAIAIWAVVNRTGDTRGGN